MSRNASGFLKFFALVFFFSQCISLKLYSQDDTIFKAQPPLLFDKIEKRSRANKFSKELYKLLFRPSAHPSNAIKPTDPSRKIAAVCREYQCNIIRKIKINTLDPFGYSITDSLLMPTGFLPRAGNALHAKTRMRTIANLMLVKTNDEFDSLLIKESERLIRTQAYVRDVMIIPEPVDNTDSIDLYVRVLDAWSIIVEAGFSSAKTKLDITDKNFLGTGHSFENIYQWYFNTRNAFESVYYIPNISNTFINSKFQYALDERRQESLSIALERPFYSAVTKWAGGLAFKQTALKPEFTIADYQLTDYYKFNVVDVWAGRSIKLFNLQNIDVRNSNFIVATRYLTRQYLVHPSAQFDSLGLLKNENFYLAGLGFSSRNYLQEKYLFKYGNIEDVPVGRTYGLTLGYRERSGTGAWYVGGKISFGDYFSYGYVSTAAEYGTYIEQKKFQNGVFKASVNYFTPLISTGKWRIRQFVKPELTLGINRSSNDFVTLDDNIRGFNSPLLRGTKKIVCTLQTQTYSPWMFLGFRFGPYLISSFGLVGDQQYGFSKSKLYSQFGIGLLIKNEYLTLSNFEVSLAFYPVIPDNGFDILKVNPLRTSNLGLRDFDIEKPEVVTYEK
jgi:hypothetical protein